MSKKACNEVLSIMSRLCKVKRSSCTWLPDKRLVFQVFGIMYDNKCKKISIHSGMKSRAHKPLLTVSRVC